MLTAAPVPEDPDSNSFDLVRRAQGGDAHALNELIERYYARVRQIVRMRLGHELREYTESADILQDTFEAAAKAIDRFEMRSESSFLHWLSKIAEHKIKGNVDRFNALKRSAHDTVPVDPGGSSSTGIRAIDPSAGGASPLDEVIRVENEEALVRAMALLRPDYREVIVHHTYEQASWAEVAEWMQLPGPDAARMMYGRAIVELARLLRGELGEPPSA